MNIVFRADASITTGAGHVMRCLALADELRHDSIEVAFVCRQEEGNLIAHIESKGHPVYRLPAGINKETDAQLTREFLERRKAQPGWLIVDHYDLDYSWESQFRQLVKKIMVIDDLANRKHDCDLLLDQNYHTGKDRYRDLVPEGCVQLLDPRYALLRPQFREMREKLGKRTESMEKVLVFMGGADLTNETGKTLRALHMLRRKDIHIDVVIGASNPHRDEIEALASQVPDTACHSYVENMAELMGAADISIGACGTATWERCCVGVPSLVMAIAENQRSNAEGLAREGCLVYSGWHERVTETRILEDLIFLINHPEIRNLMSLKSATLVDGLGTKRVKGHLLCLCTHVYLREATPDDCYNVFQWRNHPATRKHSFDPALLLWLEHERWFSRAVSGKDTALLIAECKDGFVGVLRYDLKSEEAVVSVYVVPNYIGKGYGAHILKAGNQWVRGNYPEVKKITAEITPHNTASISVFRKAGFTETKSVYTFFLAKEGK